MAHTISVGIAKRRIAHKTREDWTRERGRGRGRGRGRNGNET